METTVHIFLISGGQVSKVSTQFKRCKMVPSRISIVLRRRHPHGFKKLCLNTTTNWLSMSIMRDMIYNSKLKDIYTFGWN